MVIICFGCLTHSAIAFLLQIIYNATIILMRIQKNKKQKRYWILALTAMVLLYLTNSWYFKFFPFSSNQPGSDNTINSTPTSEQTKPQETSDKATANPNIKEVEKNNPTSYEGADPNESPSLFGVISYQSVTNGKLAIRTTIDQIVRSGACELSLTNSKTGKVVYKQAQIIINPSSSTCEGFDIPLTELGSGAWQIKINLSGQGKAGVIEGSVQIEEAI